MLVMHLLLVNYLENKFAMQPMLPFGLIMMIELITNTDWKRMALSMPKGNPSKVWKL
jgi:hypothetical protein